MSQAVAYGSITVVDITDLGTLSVQPMSNLPQTVIFNPNTSEYIPDWRQYSDEQQQHQIDGYTSLYLTPIIYYGGQQLRPGTDSGITVTWKKRLGAGEEIDISSSAGQVPNSTTQVLKVNKNPFQYDSNLSLLTYIVKVDYVEPTAGVQLHASGQITFSLIRHASELKNIEIIGQNIFKLDSNGNAIGGDNNGNASITLTTRRTGINVSKWQYKAINNGTETWTDFSPAETGNTLTIYLKVNNNNVWQRNPIFNSTDRASIRVLTDNDGTNNLYDLHDIILLSNGTNGTPGTSTVSAILSNEDQMIPYTTSKITEPGADYGKIVYNISSGFQTTSSTITIYEGNNDITNEYTVRFIPSQVLVYNPNGSNTTTGTNYTATLQNNTYVLTGRTQNTRNTIIISGMEKYAKSGVAGEGVPYDIGEVIIECIHDNANYGQKENVTKKFSLVAVFPGQDGIDGVSPTIYSISPSTLVINRNGSNPPYSYMPQILTVNAFSQQGSEITPYEGMFRLILNHTLQSYKAALQNQTTVTPLVNSTVNATSCSYTFNNDNNTNRKNVLCILYKENTNITDTTLLYEDYILDTQQVIFTSDGQQGDPAINVVLSNYADVLSCDKNGNLKGSQTIQIQFAAYKGIDKVVCTPPTVSDNSLKLFGSSGSPSSSTASSASTNGSIIWNLTAGTSITASSGSLHIPFVVTIEQGVTTTVYADYSWSKVVDGQTGAAAVLLQIYAPNGNIFNQNSQSNSITLQGFLTEGSQSVDSNVSYQWYKFNPAASPTPAYELLTGETNSSLIVTAASVNSYASYQLIATYNNNPYKAYFAVFDKTDPIQISVHSSVGNQLVNGKGQGALYVKVTRNGQQIDVMPGEVFYKGSDEPTGSNGDFAYQIQNNGTFVLKKYSNGSWANASSQEIQNYTPKLYYKWSWRDKDGKIQTTYPEQATPMPGMTPSPNNKIIYINGDMIASKVVADVTVWTQNPNS